MTSLLIDPARLHPLLADQCGRFDVDAVAECASTNTLLLERAARGAPSGSVLVADRQTAGRGRRGRQWMSSAESGLTFSVLWRFSGGIERLSGLSLAVGVAVARAVESCGASPVRLKWPNDILLGTPAQQGKLGGILVELQSEQRQKNERPGMLAVIGIGINLALPPALAADGAPGLPVAALAQATQPLPERHVLLARLLCELGSALDRFSVGGFAALREEWLARQAWPDQAVRLLHEGETQLSGLCRGVDGDGALLIETPAGIERCLSGDLSLRTA